MHLVRFYFGVAGVLFVTTLASAQDVREWSDATGRFKITGSLVKVEAGVAFIKNSAGNTLKVPVAKLSQPDQDLLQGGDNPFEMVGWGQRILTINSSL